MSENLKKIEKNLKIEKNKNIFFLVLKILNNFIIFLKEYFQGLIDEKNRKKSQKLKKEYFI